MSPLGKLTLQISSASSLSASEISPALRVLGFRASTAGLHQVISVSSSLTSHFSNLEQHFPNAKKILKDFQTCNEIQKIINSLPSLDKEDPKRKSQSKKYAPFCDALASKEFKHIDFVKYPRVGEMFAFFWLIHASAHAEPGLAISPELGSLLNLSLNLARSMWMVVEDNPSFTTKWKISLQDNLSDWLAEAGKAIEQASKSNLAISISSRDIQNGFEQARQLIGKLTTAHESDPLIIKDGDEQQPEFSERRGVGLDVGEYGLGAENRHGGGGRDERERRQDHLVAGAHAHGLERQLQRGGAVIHAQAELGAYGRGEFGVEGLVLGTQDEDARVQHARDGGLNLGADLVLLALQGEKGNVHCGRGHKA